MTTIQTSTSLDAAVKDSGLQAESAASLLEVFQPYFNRAAEINLAASGLKVTDATQLTEMKKAREYRLALREIRIEAEKVRKAQKEDSLRRGQAIDKVAKVIVNITEPAEAMLLDMECFAERAEAARKAALKAEREKLLAPYGVDVTLFALGDMNEVQWEAVLDGTRMQHAAKIEAAKKAEADRIEADRLRAEEDARVRAENARLRQEADERAASAKIEHDRQEAEKRAIQEAASAEAKAARDAADAERTRLEAEAAKERSARLELERAAQAKADAEAAQRKADEAAARKAARAPDKVKLQAFANAVRALAVPEVSDLAAKKVLTDIEAKAEAFAKWIEQQIATLD